MGRMVPICLLLGVLPVAMAHADDDTCHDLGEGVQRLVEQAEYRPTEMVVAAYKRYLAACPEATFAVDKSLGLLIEQAPAPVPVAAPAAPQAAVGGVNPNLPTLQDVLDGTDAAPVAQVAPKAMLRQLGESDALHGAQPNEAYRQELDYMEGYLDGLQRRGR